MDTLARAQLLRDRNAAAADTIAADSVAASRHRFYDPVNAAWLVKVFPGEFYVTSKRDEVLVTVLGSCVSACIRDPKTGIGGMNHFMLPQGDGESWDGESARYGNFAMEKLINELVKNGCPRERMEVKVFGGGNVIESSTRIGTMNADFVLRFLESEGIACAARDLGGPHPRRIQYYPSSGRVVRRLLPVDESVLIAREEKNYASRLSAKPTAGEIELFGD
jgi:chemotaxis protein CheD